MVLAALNGGGATSLAVPLPSDAMLCGANLYLRALFFDPAAGGFYHTAQTAGLQWTLGS